MKESMFYKMCDVVEEIEMEGMYYPTIEEIQRHNVTENMDKYLPMLIYFSNNPFKKMGMELAEKKEYKEMVDYVRKLLYNYKFK